MGSMGNSTARQRREQRGAATGLLAVVIGVAAMLFERGPLLPGDPAAAAAHLAAHHGAMVAQSMLLLAGSGVYLWFLGSLRAFAVRYEPAPGRLSHVLFGAGIAWVSMSMVAQAFQLGVATAPGSSASPELIATMNAMFTIANLPLALLLGAVAVVSLRYRAFPVWLGCVAAVAGLAQALLWLSSVIQTGPLAPDGWLSYALYPAFVIWLVPTVIVMIKRLGPG